MTRRRPRSTMSSMFAPMVTETPPTLEPVTVDTFIADLDHRSGDTNVRPAALRKRAATAPRARIYD
jgi:hypothetical protein